MKVPAIVFSLALATGLFGQAPHRSFGSVVFPGGTSRTSPGATRNFGSMVFPGGAPIQPVHGGGAATGAWAGAGATNQGARRGAGNATGNGRGLRYSTPYVYAFPTYVGGYYDGSYGAQDQALQPPMQQPDVTVIDPPQQQVKPVMIQVGPDGEYTTTPQRQGTSSYPDATHYQGATSYQGATIYQAPREELAATQPDPAADAARYLLAFKDHTIYSAVAYWADGDTLHYFTTGNTHNQASLSLLDRDLTNRLNRELGIDFKLPAAK